MCAGCKKKSISGATKPPKHVISGVLVASFQTLEHFQDFEVPSCSAGYSLVMWMQHYLVPSTTAGRCQEAPSHLTDWVFHCKVIFTPLIRASKEYCFEPEQQAPRQSRPSLTTMSTEQTGQLRLTFPQSQYLPVTHLLQHTHTHIYTHSC